MPSEELHRSHWHLVMHDRWLFDENILVLEARALLKAATRVCQSERCFDGRALLLGDNMSVVLSFSRCRAKSFPLLVQIRRLAALSFACNIKFSCRWLPSELNNSDAGSRRYDEFYDSSKDLTDKVKLGSATDSHEAVQASSEPESGGRVFPGGHVVSSSLVSSQGELIEADAHTAAGAPQRRTHAVAAASSDADPGEGGPRAEVVAAAREEGPVRLGGDGGRELEEPARPALGGVAKARPGNRHLRGSRRGQRWHYFRREPGRSRPSAAALGATQPAASGEAPGRGRGVQRQVELLGGGVGAAPWSWRASLRGARRSRWRRPRPSWWTARS